MTNEMIERVAKAVEDALQRHGDADIKAGLAFIDLAPVARAAIEAMREPTIEMLLAGGIIYLTSTGAHETL